MNQHPAKPPVAVGDPRLDRLVDGELSPHEYRELLQSLEQSPEGWKQCALAFLEAQAWRQELPAIQATETLQRTVARGASQRWADAAVRWLAIAASVAIAFWCGNSWTEWHQPETARPDAHPAPPRVRPLAKIDAPPPLMGPDAIELVTLNPQGDAEYSRRLPIEPSQPRWDERYNSESPTNTTGGTTPWWVDQLGRRVRREQQFWPLELPDGRKLLLPVEKVEVQPARRPAY